MTAIRRSAYGGCVTATGIRFAIATTPPLCEMPQFQIERFTLSGKGYTEG